MDFVNGITLPLKQENKRVFNIWIHSSSAIGNESKRTLSNLFNTSDLKYQLKNPLESRTGFFNVKVASFQLGHHKDINGVFSPFVPGFSSLQIRANFHSPYCQEILNTEERTIGGISHTTTDFINKGLIPISNVSTGCANNYQQTWGSPLQGFGGEPIYGFGTTYGDQSFPPSYSIILDNMETTISNNDNLTLRIQLVHPRSTDFLVDNEVVISNSFEPFLVNLQDRLQIPNPPTPPDGAAEILTELASNSSFTLPYSMCLSFTEV